MVAIVTGSGLGVQAGSGLVLGSAGQLGQAQLGRGRDQAYVNAANGNLVIGAQDQWLVGQGPDAAVYRAYNSQGTGAGTNWQTGDTRRVTGLTGTVNTAGSTVKRVDWDGTETLYRYVAARQRYETSDGAGAYDALVFTAADQRWTWTQGSGRQIEVYDHAQAGRIISGQDTDGNVRAYVYNAKGLLAEVRTQSGEKTLLVYDASDRLIQLKTVAKGADNVTDVTTLQVTYSYGSTTDKRISKVSVSVGPSTKVYETTYAYVGTSNQIESITTTGGGKVSFTYDASNRVKTIVQWDGTASRTTTLTYAAGKTSIVDPLGLTTNLYYDAKGQLTRIESPAVGGATISRHFAYDTDGNVSSVTDGAGNVTTYQYDGQGNVIRQQDAAGNVIVRTYSSTNDLVSETRYRVAKDLATGASESGAETTRYVYDSEQHLRFVIGAEGSVTEYRYSAAGEQTSLIRYAASRYTDTSVVPTEATLTTWLASADKVQAERTDTTYDFRGNVASVVRYNRLLATGEGDVAAGVQKTLYVYDPYGNLIKRFAESAPGESETYVYDTFGRVLSSIDGRGLTTTYTYDDAANKVVVTLANGLTRTSVYNRYGELVSVAEAVGGTVRSQTSYAYDALGRLRMVTDPTGIRTHYLYDEAGRKVADVLTRDGTDGTASGTGSLVEYRYDGQGRLIRTISYATALSATALAKIVASNGKPIETLLSGDALTLENVGIRPALSVEDRYEWRIYDTAGRVVRTISGTGAIVEYEYDGASRLIRTTERRLLLNVATWISNAQFVPGMGDVPNPPATHTDDRETRYAYDMEGRLRFVLQPPGGGMIEYRYDAAARRTTTIRYAIAIPGAVRDAEGDLASKVPANHAKDIREYQFFDAAGQVVLALDGEGGATRTTYDDRGRAIQVEQGKSLAIASAPNWTTASALTAYAAAATPASLQMTQFSYDGNGNLTQAVRYLEGGVAEAESFEYNASNQVTRRALGGREWLNQYDEQGRLLSETGRDGTVTRTYDASGRMTSSTDGNGLRTLYYYDAAGNLRFKINPLGEVEEIRYNVFGNQSASVVRPTRLGTSVLAGLGGGLVNSALVGALAGLGESINKTYSYSRVGDLAKVVDALGLATTYVSIFGELKTKTEQLGAGKTNVTTYAYDRLGRQVYEYIDSTGLAIITRSAYDVFGRTTTKTDANGVVTSFSYDRADNLLVATRDGKSDTYTYDKLGNAITHKDRNGNTTSYTYTAFNRQLTVTTAEGATSITRQNAFGEVTWSQDARGAVSVQNYDTNGRLTSTVQAQGSLNLTASNVCDAGGRLTQTTDARGTVTQYVYDGANRLTQRIVDPAGLNLVTSYAYDTEGRVIQTTDPEGRITSTTFDALGRVQSIIVDPAGLAIETRFAYPDKMVTEITYAFGTAEARLTRHTYDRAGRLVQTQVDPTGLNLVTQYAYDKAGNVVRKTDAAGNVTRYAYDANGQLAYEVDALLGVTRFEYDGLGNIVAQTRYATPISLLPEEESVALTTTIIAGKLVANAQQDRATRTAYDRDGRLRYSVDALGYVREQVWDANGNRVRTIAYAVPVALEGILTAAQIATAVAGQATAAANRVETSVYDAANRQVFHIDVLGTVTQNTFDAGGNLVTQVRYKTAYTATAVPTEAQVTTWLAQSGIKDATKDRTQRWFYDAANRQRVAIDAGGAITEFGYNKVGEVIRRAQYLNSYTVANGASLATVLALLPVAPTTITATVPTGMRVTLYQYDAAGRAISEGLAGYQQVTREFDKQGQVTKVTTRDLVSSVQSEILYSYDRAGRLETQTEATGVAGVSVTTQYEYDGNGRLIKEVDGRGNLKYAGYDGVGRRTTVTDAYGKITQTDYNLFGEAVKITDAAGNAGYFYFDQLGRNTLQVDPEGYVTRTTYGATDRPLTVTRYATKAIGAWSLATPPTVVTTAPTEADAVYVLAVTARDAVTKFEYDKADRLAKTTDAEGKFESYAYDGFGDRISYTNKLGGVFQYVYDKMGRLTKETLPVTSKNAAGTPIAVVNQFVYNLAGNMTSKIEAVGLPEQRTTTMIYDVRGLMTERRGQARTTYVYGTGTANNVVPKETWKYDGRGNAIEYKDARLGATTWTYDARNLRRTETRADGGRTEWDYDEVGNVAVQRVYGDLNLDSNKTYRETRYSYDALNRVIETRVPGVQWARFNTATNTVEGLTGDAVVITRYDALGRVVSVKDANYNANNGGGITYYFYDKVGNKVFQVDGESYATSWTYDAEGNVLQERRYATKPAVSTLDSAGGAPETINVETLRAEWTVNAADRIKTYTYDRNGRKLTEGIGGFVYSNVNATTGGLTSSTTTVTTRYAYDAMGNLAYQTDARNNRVDYTYDALGRLTQNQQATFVDYRDQSVRATTQYVYNGLDAVVQETKLGAGDADRVSTFTYDAGLLKTQNIAGIVTTYDYDATGNITRVSIDRSDADGAVRNEAELIKYDAMNREVLRASTWKASSDTTWTTTLVKEVRYNKYGEITGRRSAAAAGVAATPWQEYADYDSAGKVWRTNAGQGITKVLQYDLNGNVTRIRESQTTNLRPLGYAAAMMANEDIFNTVSLYDKRNQVIKVIQPEMSGRADVPTLRASTIIPIGGGSVAGVPVQASTGAQQNPGADRTTQAGDNFGLAGSQTVTTTTSGYLQGWGPGETNETSLIGTLQSVKVNLPNFSKIFGSAQVRVVVEFVATFSTTFGPFQQTGSEQRFVSGTGGELVVNFNRSIGASAYNAIPTAQITTITKVFLTPSGQSSETQVAVVNHNVSLEAEYVYGWDGEGYSWYQTGNILMNGQGSASTPLADQLRLRLHPSASRDRSFLYYKTSSGSFQRLATNDYSAPGPTGSWQTHPGFIGANVASLPRGSYELLLVSVDGQGNVLQHNLYNMQLGTTDASTSLSLVTGSNNVAYTGNGWRVDRTGLYVRLADAVDFFDLRKSLDSATAEHAYRVKVTYKNTNGSTVSQNLYASSVLGKVTWNLSGVNLAQPIDIGLFSTTDQSLGELTGAITGQQPSFLYAHAKSSAVVFKWLPINIASASVTYVASGGATGTIALKPTGTGEFYFDYVAAGLAQGSYLLKLSAWDSAGNLSYRSQSSLALGAVNSVMFSGEALPATVQFTFYNGQYDSALMGAVTHIEMRYRPKGSQGDFQSTTITNSNGAIDYQSGKFKWQPLEALQDTDYEYYYDVYVAGGQMSSEPLVLTRNSGSFRPYSPTSTSNNQIQWVWDGFVDLDATIQRKQTYNAFGEVASETDGRDYTTNLYYNTMGLLTRKLQPSVTYTTATGLQASIRPDTYYYYDLLGQLVGVRDANTNVNTQAWRTGPDGKSMVVQEWHADDGTKKFGFDVFGNRRYSIDEEGRRTDYTYDAQGRLTLVERPVDPDKGNARSTERYEYDQLGYRIASVDALGNRTKTYYDVANRVTRFVSPQGRATMNYAYTYDSTIVGIDGTAAGGWVRTTTNATGLYTTDKLDVFDRVLSHRDFGGHQFTYTYNKAGLISSQQGTSGQSISYAYYGNGLLASVTDNGAHTTSTYQYDKDGNRTREIYAVAGGTLLQNAVIQYDALNRVKSITGGDYDISYEYDAVGNRRRVYSKYTDGLGNTNVEQDYWYAYDKMNRFTITMGQLAGARGGASTTIVAGTTGDGVQIAYDKAGQRLSATYAGNSQTPAHTESYAYDANGYLTTVTIGGIVRAERVNDAAGRVVRYIERNENNSVRTDATRTWDADGLQTLETDSLTGRTTTYTYSGEGSLNTVVSEGGGSTKTTTSYTYEWWDSAKQKEVKVQGDNGQSGWAPGFSRFTYDVNGNVKSATDVVGKREFRYLVDGDGQVLRRDEYLGSETNASGELVSARGNRSHSYYYLGGHRVGNVGNDGVERVDYAQELSRVTPEQTKAEDYYKRFKPSAGADFDENYMPINSGYPGSAPGAYTVRTGETLRSIATSLWGDAALWWILADANGLSGDDALVAGTVLRVPNKVTNMHNTSETYRPYDPGKALGNTSPTLPEPPPPPGRGGCGGMGQILSVVVAVVATIYTAGFAASVLAPGMAVGAGATAATAGAMASGAAALAGGSLASAAIGGAVGALAGQVTAMATGVQDKFSWTGVALGAVGAGVTAGLGQATGLTAALANALESKVAVQIALGGIRSAATQGIGVVTGLQSSFDWKGVAASAIAGGVAQKVSGLPWGDQATAEYMTRGMAAGVTSALVRGQSLSRNIGNIALDIIGSTVGNQIAAGLAGMSSESTVKQAALPSVYLASSGGEGSQAAMYEAWRMALEQTGPEVRFLGEQPHLRVDVHGSTLLEQLSEQAGGAALGMSQSATESLNAARRVDDRPVAEMRAIEPSVWEQVWGGASVQHVMNNTMTGKLVGGLVRTAGNAWASVSESRYDFAKLKTLTLVEQRDARIDTLLNAALVPLGGGPVAGIKGEMAAARAIGTREVNALDIAVNTNVATERRVLEGFANNSTNRIYRNLDQTINERDLLAQERVQAEAAGWKRADGSTWWPPHDGAIPGTQKIISLEPMGQSVNLVDRFGRTSGRYVSPAGTPLGGRALSYTPDFPPSVYSVDGVIENVEKSTIAPWFGQKGLAAQYKLENSVQFYIDTMRLGAQ